MQSYFLRILTQKCGRYVCVQLLQTLNILFENIRNETSICMSVCLSVYVYLSVCLPVCIYVCLFVCLSICMSTHGFTLLFSSS